MSGEAPVNKHQCFQIKEEMITVTALATVQFNLLWKKKTKKHTNAFLAFYGSNTFRGFAIKHNDCFHFSTNTSALETSRLSLMGCEWAEWDFKSQTIISQWHSTD